MQVTADGIKQAYGKGGVDGLDTIIRQKFDRAAARELTTQNGINKLNELLININAASRSFSAQSIPPVSSSDATQGIKDSVNYNIQFGNQTLTLTGDASQKDIMIELVNQLKGVAKST